MTEKQINKLIVESKNRFDSYQLTYKRTKLIHTHQKLIKEFDILKHLHEIKAVILGK